MKKLIVATLTALGGALAVKRFTGHRREQDLWAEATDGLPR